MIHSPIRSQETVSHNANIPAAENSWTLLVASAIAVGQMRGEPAVVIPRDQHRSLFAQLFGQWPVTPLANHKLEVIRAISAWLTQDVRPIRADLVAAALTAGWDVDDLRSIFPDAVMPCSSRAEHILERVIYKARS